MFSIAFEEPYLKIVRLKEKEIEVLYEKSRNFKNTNEYCSSIASKYILRINTNK